MNKSALRPKPGNAPDRASLPKAATGVHGLDEVTGGGLPRGRPTLVCGGAGCGKTLLAMEFLVRGATVFGEHGVFMAFEESTAELAQNVRSLGFDLDELVRKKALALDHVHVDRSEIEENGEYDLEGLFIRLGYAIDSIGAKRVVLDTLETLFSGFSNVAILRAELRRLFRWLKERGVTAIITGERGQESLTRHGLEEYVSDCVIVLDHRVKDQMSTRRLRVMKYRGTAHGTNEYPFLIDQSGFSVLPITSVGLRYEVSNERVSTGVPRLDAMLGGAGVYRGSTVLVSGTAGTGKTSLGAHFADAACRRGERCHVFAFEESPQQVLRNMKSIGLALEPWLRKGLLRFDASRPTLGGLEMHLVHIARLVREFAPSVVVIDPISNFLDAGSPAEARQMLMRLLDILKAAGTTTFMTDLSGGGPREATDFGISSIVDTWLQLRDVETNGERNRTVHVLKSRGMAHSNQVREFLLTGRGIELCDVYIGPEGVLTGSSRLAQQARESASASARAQEAARREREIARRRREIEARIAALRAELERDEEDFLMWTERERDAERQLQDDRRAMALSRKADPGDAGARPARSGGNSH